MTTIDQQSKQQNTEFPIKKPNRLWTQRIL